MWNCIVIVCLCVCVFVHFWVLFETVLLVFVLWNVLYKKKKKIIIIKKYNFIIMDNIRCDIINTTKLEVSITF